MGMQEQQSPPLWRHHFTELLLSKLECFPLSMVSLLVIGLIHHFAKIKS
jgi:hypothetical protein